MNSLQFGTAGIRGIMGEKQGEMNNLLVQTFATALAKYMRQGKVLVGYDTRHNSDIFAKTIVKTLTLFGVEAVMFSHFVPTPVLTFCTKQFGYDYGVMVTASHNPKEYNGIKVVDSFGAQITGKIIDDLQQNMKDAQVVDLDETNQLQVKFAPKTYIEKYLKFCYEQKTRDADNIKVCFSTLHGTGFEYAKAVLDNLKAKYTYPQNQVVVDANFTTCETQNPEFDGAYKLCLKQCETYNADIIAVLDPDADRLGVMAKNKGVYQKINGNQLGLIFCYHILRNLKRKGFVVSTIVTSPKVADLCKLFMAKHYETLTGFRNMADLAKQKITLGETPTFIFEEAIGFETTGKMFDKDGITALQMIVEIASIQKNNKKTLFDLLDEIKGLVGEEIQENENIMFSGKDAQEKMSAYMENLRNNPPKDAQIVDYLKNKAPLKADVIKIIDKQTTTIVRPSGTEPKVKIYKFITKGVL